jgi:hypothetical protein
MSIEETAVYTDAESGTLKARRFRVTVLSGNEAGKSKSFEGGTLLVGKDPKNDLALTDKGVSRYHLELQLLSDGLRVTDLESTNGTFLRLKASQAGPASPGTDHGAARIQSVVIVGAATLKLGSHCEIEIVPDDVAVKVAEFTGDHFGEAIGAAPAMRDLFALLERVAPT